MFIATASITSLRKMTLLSLGTSAPRRCPRPARPSPHRRPCRPSAPPPPSQSPAPARARPPRRPTRRPLRYICTCTAPSMPPILTSFFTSTTMNPTSFTFLATILILVLLSSSLVLRSYILRRRYRRRFQQALADGLFVDLDRSTLNEAGQFDPLGFRRSTRQLGPKPVVWDTWTHPADKVDTWSSITVGCPSLYLYHHNHHLSHSRLLYSARPCYRRHQHRSPRPSPRLHPSARSGPSLSSLSCASGAHFLFPPISPQSGRPLDHRPQVHQHPPIQAPATKRTLPYSPSACSSPCQTCLPQFTAQYPIPRVRAWTRSSLRPRTQIHPCRRPYPEVRAYPIPPWTRRDYRCSSLASSR